jgi:restriction system protein
MSKTSKKKKILIGKNVTLEQWLDLMEKRPKDVRFYDFMFPTDEIRDEFLVNIFNYPDSTVLMILRSFLQIPTGTLGSDVDNLDSFVYIRDNDPEKAKRMLEIYPYYQRLLDHAHSPSKTPLRDGITWVIDSLFLSAREALDALEAYYNAHFLHLPDGRSAGLSDAIAILRCRYFSSDEKVANSILYSLKPIDFEHLVESLYIAMGYETAMTQMSHDGGRDIIATKREPGKKEKILIQCKRWQNVVGVEDVRALLGVVAHEKATKGTLVSTSHFSPDANTFADENPSIELIPFKAISGQRTQKVK